jgi:hypothetical protein
LLGHCADEILEEATAVVGLTAGGYACTMGMDMNCERVPGVHRTIVDSLWLVHISHARIPREAYPEFFVGTVRYGTVVIVVGVGIRRSY